MRPPVLCYHRIGGPLELGVTRVSTSVFARQMRALARAGWTTLSLDAFAAGAAPLTTHRSPLTFLLTFDDGYALLARHAYPVLADLGFTATTFVITDYIGRTNAWDARYTWQRLAHLDWATIETWRARGFDFGSHTASHPRLTWLDNGRVSDELARSRDVLVQRLGAGAGRGVAYPFGAADARVEGLARAAGYEVGFGMANAKRDGVLNVPRIPVYMWDVGDVPLGLRGDRLGALGRFVAHVASRCAVGTTVVKELGAGISGLEKVSSGRSPSS